MAVYVDEKGDAMFADKPDDLHRMARMLGLDIMDKQETGDGVPFFSLTERQRRIAILLGAFVRDFNEWLNASGV